MQSSTFEVEVEACKNSRIQYQNCQKALPLPHAENECYLGLLIRKTTTSTAVLPIVSIVLHTTKF